MKLYLLRHAQAAAGGSDATRPLSPEGEETVRLLGRFLVKHGIALPETFFHSPLLRARRTAEILAEARPGRHTCRPGEALAPLDDVAIPAGELGRSGGDRVLVGHEPHLGRLASLLVCGDENAAAFEMKKAALLRLDHTVVVSAAGPVSRWVVRWMLTPEVYRDG